MLNHSYCELIRMITLEKLYTLIIIIIKTLSAGDIKIL